MTDGGGSGDGSVGNGSTGAGAGAGCTLHRVRFLDWQPSPITALAFAPLPPRLPSSALRPVLAIARQNGSIELCQWGTASAAGHRQQQHGPPPRPWSVDAVIINPHPANVQSLCFVLDSHSHVLRLFSISGGALVTEHALPASVAGLYVRHGSSSNPFSTASLSAQGSSASADAQPLTQSRSLPSHSGTVWSISPSPLGTKLALGCEDGRVRLIDIAHGRFQHLDPSSPLARRRRPDGTVRGVAHTLDTAKGRIMCLAWGPPVRTASTPTARAAPNGHARDARSADSDSSNDDDEEEAEDDSGEVAGWSESFLVGGTSSSHAVLWELATGHTLARLQTPTARTRSHIDGPTIVWACAVLPDGTIILGDSTGRVTFYDGRTRVPLPGAAFASHGQNADVLALCVGPDGKTVYSGGVDQRVAEYTLIPTSRLGGDGGEGGVPRRGGGGGGAGKWVQSGIRRFHAHDIRALAIEPAFDMMRHAQHRHDALARQGDRSAPVQQGGDVHLPPRLPILASGGLDFHLVLTPAAPPTSLQARDGSGRTVAALPSHGGGPKGDAEDAMDEDDADADDDDLDAGRSPSKRRARDADSAPQPTSNPAARQADSKGKGAKQGRTASGLDAARIAETARLYNPISTTTLVNFADTTQRRVPFVPLNSLGAGAGAGSGGLGSALAGGTVAAVLRHKRWIVLRREKSVAIWALTRAGSDDPTTAGEMGFDTLGNDPNNGWTKLLDLEPRLRSQIVSAAIHPSGRFLAISDLFETKLFALSSVQEDASSVLVPSKVPSLSKAFEGAHIAPAASSLAFSASDNTLVLCTHRGARIHIVHIDEHPDGSPSSATCTRQTTIPPRDGSTSTSILHAGVSPDGSLLATLDDNKRIHVYSARTGGHVRTMPSLAERPASLVWHALPLAGTSQGPASAPGSGSTQRLVALSPSGHIYAWDLEDGDAPSSTMSVEDDHDASPRAGSKARSRTLHHDAKRWACAMTALLVPVLSSIKDPAVGVLWVPSASRSTDAQHKDGAKSGKDKRRRRSSASLHHDQQPTETMLVWGPNWLCTVVERDASTASDGDVNGALDDLPNGHGTPTTSRKRTRAAHTLNGTSDLDATPNGKSHGSGAATQSTHQPSLTTTSATDAQARTDAARYTTRLTFRYASVLLVDIVDAPAPAASASSPPTASRTDSRTDSGGAGAGADAELVVVERPFFDLVPHLAPAYNRGARYGE